MSLRLKWVFGALLLCAAYIPLMSLAQTAKTSPSSADTAESLAQAAWRKDIAGIATPGVGCYTATYPSIVWKSAPCSAGENPSPVMQTSHLLVVGNPVDYSLGSAKRISQSIGTFSSINNLTSEQTMLGSPIVEGPGRYSLQLNSNFYNDPDHGPCEGHAGCQLWEQFAYTTYSNPDGSAGLSIWYVLLNYGETCPAGWSGSNGSRYCYGNPTQIEVPNAPISDLGSIVFSASAASGGLDAVVLVDGIHAYSQSAEDSVLNLANYWNESEFNVFGDGGRSRAVFNLGSSLTVNLAVNNGSVQAPVCLNSGSAATGETNSWTLGSCIASGGAMPSIRFSETSVSTANGGTAMGTGAAAQGGTVTTGSNGTGTANGGTANGTGASANGGSGTVGSGGIGVADGGTANGTSTAANGGKAMGGNGGHVSANGGTASAGQSANGGTVTGGAGGDAAASGGTASGAGASANGGTAVAGNGGSATANGGKGTNGGTTTGGDGGGATAIGGTAAGNHSEANGGMATGGNGGNATARGTNSTATGGDGSSAYANGGGVSGNRSQANGGKAAGSNGGDATANGDNSTATGISGYNVSANGGTVVGNGSRANGGTASGNETYADGGTVTGNGSRANGGTANGYASAEGGTVTGNGSQANGGTASGNGNSGANANGGTVTGNGSQANGGIANGNNANANGGTISGSQGQANGGTANGTGATANGGSIN